MDDLIQQAKLALEGASGGKRVQYHPHYCNEAKGTPLREWDSWHDLSVVSPMGGRRRLASYRYAGDAFLSQIAPDLARALLAADELWQAVSIMPYDHPALSYEENERIADATSAFRKAVEGQS